MNLSMALALVYEQLNAVAQSPDYWTILNTAFGDSYDRDLAIQLQRRWQGRDFGDLPSVEVLSQDVLGGARGAYAAGNNTIYLADSFLANASLESLSAVLLEEIGHYVDGLINAEDSPGDEGEIFAALVLGVELSQLDLENLKAQSDQFTIWVDNQLVQVEAATIVVTTLNDVIDAGDGVISLREAIASSIAGDTITFANNLLGGAITLNGTELVINKSLTINGDINGDGKADITISGNNASRVFLIDDGNGSNLAQVELSSLTITGGNVSGSGGGIYNRENLSLNNSTVSGNSASTGGGINNFGTATVTNSTVSGNSAGSGGGIYNNGTATVTNSTLSGNYAVLIGGGIVSNGTATVANSTLSGNSARFGGGIANNGTTSLTSAIVANNTATNGNDLLRSAGTINASNSLIENDADRINGTNTNNIIGQDPLLGPLQNNGGPTQTLALLPGSPAIDAGSNLNNPTTDQRGVTRPQGDSVDIGAFEFEFPTSLVVDILADENDGNFSAGDLSLREALALIADGGTITFANSLAGGTITLTAGQLVINKSLTLDGDINGDNGADITISGNNSSRVFLVDDGNGSNLAQVELSALTITGGNVSGDGGGILNLENLSLNNSTLSGNSARFGGGGGIGNDRAGTATVANSTLSGNSAEFGGGIYNRGTATVNNSTLSGNSARLGGGGIYNIDNGTATVTNSTLSGNSAQFGGGGGIFNFSGTTSLTSAIVANNTATNGNDLRLASGTINASNSLIENNADRINGTNTNNITGQDPLLGPLQDNGGPTQTLALLPGSPAINAGSNPNNLATDQRGFGRRIGAGVDIGAVELVSELVVDILADENDGDFSAGDLSLREALALIADGGTITFANSLAGGTIILTAGQLVINKSLTLDGDINGDNGADITISGNNSSRVFLIDDGNGSNLAQVELSALTITGGNTGGSNGGGIFNRENLSLNNSTLSGNFASSGYGGGIFNDGTATVTNSTLSDNFASSGGGIDNRGTATVTNSTLSDNFASKGGGIRNYGTATVDKSTLSGNSAGVRGGGIYNGGIFNDGTVTVTNSTVSGNSAGSGGGGIDNNYGTATVANSTLSGNSARFGGGINNNNGTISLTSAIIANNTATNNIIFAGSNDILGLSGTINASNSLIENNADQINGTNTNNITGQDPRLGPLQNNGGPTQTLALLPGSPAINAGSNPNNLATDQRGVARLQGAGVDIGAVEFLSELVVDTLVDENDGNFSAGDLSLREALALIADGGTITFAIPGSGVQTINLLSALPEITGQITIDGTSQPGYSGAPLIALNGTSAGSAANGLTLASGSDGSQIKGLIINLFEGNGIVIQSSNNVIQDNSIFNNGKLGIDLGNDGITDNDLGDGDVGANALQNSPRLSLAPNGMVAGSLNSAANTTFQVQFFSNSVPDPSGYGEGETFLGAISVTTDGDGNGNFSFDPGSATNITATATDPSGNTSEFSNIAVTQAPTFALLTDNFTAFYNPDTFNLDYNLLGRQGGTLATTPWVPTDIAQVGNPTPNIDQGNYLLFGGVGRAALDRNFNGASAQGGLKISFDLAPNAVGSTDETLWGGISLGLSEANKSTFINAGVPHFGILFRGNGGIQAFDGGADVSGVNNGWGGAGNDGALQPFSLELTDSTDGNPFDGVGQTEIDVFANNVLIYSYVKGAGGYGDNYINLGTVGIAGFDNLRIEQLGRVPFAENGTDVVYTTTAVGDPVRNPALVYSLDGPDKDLFNISATGEISFKAPPNFEAPTDAGADNVYNLTVIASDESLTGAQHVEITVTDVNNEAPTVALDNEVLTLPENTDTTNRVKVADIVITDDAPGTNNLSLSGADAALFEIIGAELFIKAGTVLDFDTNPTLDATIQVDDPALGSSFEDSVDFSLSLQSLSLVVDILADENDGDFSAGDLSLREALARIADGGTITFANSLAGGTITLTAGQLVINKSLTLDGDINGDNGADITISGNNSSRVFLIDDGNGSNLAQVELSSLTITGGNAFSGNGGGIFNRENLSLNNSTLSGNSALNGGGIYNGSGGTMTVTNSTLSDNSANSGGGIYNRGTATVAITNSTLSGNSAFFFGGGISNRGTAEIANSTLSGNSAIEGGGIVNYSGTTSLTSAIVANNTASNGNDLRRFSGTINASNSLIENNADQINGTNANNITGVDPLLGSLQNNGGPTQTLALLPGSPAINAGSNPNDLTTDQRGFGRSIGGGVDIGAFEFLSELVVDTLVDENDGDFSAGDLSLREALALIADGGTITFANSLAGGTITLTAGQLFINKSLTLDGDINGDNGADITISGNNSSRVFLIDDGNFGNLAQVELSALTITGGNVSGTGGGIFNRENLSLNNSTVSGNSASFIGAGIANYGTATVNKSTLSGNSAGSSGGGIYNYFSGTVTVVNSTLSGNSAGSGSSGGGIVNGGTVTVANSTLSGNSAGSGGGIANIDGTISLTSAIIANNTATNNIIFAGSNDLLRLSGTINASNSLIENNADQINGTNTNNITGVDPLLGPLQNNGGPTQTLALLPGSPAINAGSNLNNPTTDQRGVTRPQGDSVDIGAFEFLSELVVDTLVDENDGDFSAGDLSLREALALIADGGTITFANSLAGGTITLTAGQLVINKSLTLDGDINGDNGADITISGNNASRIFLIDDGDSGNLAQTALNALTITGGNAGSSNGGGIYNRENLSLNNSTLSGNSSNFSGGGISNGGTATVTNSTLSGNSAGYGGGIYNRDGTATVINSTLSGNSAFGGGGILNTGTATVANSTLSGHSTLFGGGIANFGTVTVANSTLSGNSAMNGGGIYNSGTTSLTSAIVANNTASNNGNDLRRLSGTINASNSLIEDNADQINGTNTNNITGVDPQLGPLQNNGGPTQTLALLPGSPAIDAGSNLNNPTTDQRGVTRPQGDSVDIGAFELQNQPPTVALDNEVATLLENTNTTNRVKVADIVVTDEEGVGTNSLSLSGADAGIFEIIGAELFIKAGTVLDFETKASYNVTVEVDDPTVGATPDAAAPFTLTLDDINETISILNGPSNHPNATGANGSNDDFTNKSSLVPAGLNPGSTFDPSAVFFTNTIRNTGGQTSNISLAPTAPSTSQNLPSGTSVTIFFNTLSATYLYNGSDFEFNGGDGLVAGDPISATNPVRIDNLASNGTVNYSVSIDLPDGTPLSTDPNIERGFPVPITAFVDSNSNGVADDSATNITINQVYTGFLQLLKESRVLQGAGPDVQGTEGIFSTAPKNPAPGNIVEYKISYENISEPNLGSGNITLTAGTVTITEDGLLGSNNWAEDNDSDGLIDTSHVLGSAQGAGTIFYFSGNPANNLLGGEQTGVTANSDIAKYVNNLAGSVAPEAGGTFTFQRQVNQTTAGTQISNTATATYEDPNNPNVPINETRPKYKL